MNLASRRPERLAAAFALAAGAALIGISAPAAHAEQSAACNYYPYEPQLSQGDSGPAVQQLQCELNEAYAKGPLYTPGPLAVDGSFGPKTASAVKNFQACDGLPVDGIVGPATWPPLDWWVNQPTYACNGKPYGY